MRILLIEDEEDILRMLKVVFENECFAVDIAQDGEQGSYLARINEYDCIILDNKLPKKSGIDVCKDIRADGRTVPILMLSVITDTTKKVDLLNAGADDYMVKPFSFDELRARVRALLRRPNHITGDVLSIDTLRFDTRRHNVIRGAREIYLTRKEAALLEYMMRNEGIVLSRGLLLEHVWDMNADPFTNTIEAHIRSLRRKIDSTPHKKLITTVPGRGYKIG